MKKQFAFVGSLVFVLFAFVTNLGAQDFRTIKDGIEYAEVTRDISGLSVKMNLLRLDLSKVRIDVAHAFNKAIGVDTTSNIAKAHGAFAAINAGFFRLDKSEYAGDDVGLLIVDGQLLSEPSKDRTAISIVNGSRRTAVSFDRWAFAGDLRVGSRDFSGILQGLNREEKDNEVIAYTQAFGEAAPRKPDDTQLVILKGRVRSFCPTACKIPTGGFVLSGNGSGGTFLENVKPGDPVKINWKLAADRRTPQETSVEDAVTGVPQLIKDGKIDITWEKEKASRSFVETRHPRTAVSLLKDGKFLMITVDGRSKSSGGIGLRDLAEYLLSLGATDALNLDGGGSTTMFLDGKIVNQPSDKEGERKVSDTLLVTPRNKK